MKSRNDLVEMESLFSALADKIRLRILNLMRREEVCVWYFTEVLRENQSKISRHLAYLRSANLVSARREGKWMNYRIERFENIFASELIAKTLCWLESQDDMRADYDRFKLICCAAEVPATIARAPLPKTFARTNVNNKMRNEMDVFLL